MKRLFSFILVFALCAALLPVTVLAKHFDAVNGRWESVSIDWNNNTSNIHALVLDTVLVDCSQMTINMTVSMKNNTKCQSWCVLGRTNGSFQEIGSIGLPNGNGSISQTFRYYSPITVDAIAIRPTVPGNYSWSMNFTLTDVTCSDNSSGTTVRQAEPGSTEPLYRIQQGDIVKFGAYEQDNNLNNGKEPIEWVVLDFSPDGNKMLLISRYCLDSVPFSTVQKDIKWENSYIREWLNDSFYRTAFTSDDQRYISDIYSVMGNNPVYGTSGGNMTIDKVSLLSIDEAEQYFSNDTARQCAATSYAKARGTQVYTSGAWWRLRSPGKFDYSAASVYASGQIAYDGDAVSDYGCGIRPLIVFGAPEAAAQGYEQPTTNQPGSAPSGTKYRVGDSVRLGYYGNEDIYWTVIAVSGDNALVLSDKCVDSKRFHRWCSSITWKDSDIRNWLNNDFYWNAFSDADRQRVRYSTVFDSNEETGDYVFLLSVQEAEALLTDRTRMARPTEYAKRQGATAVAEDGGTGFWWLRSSGNGGANYAANVASDGKINYTGFSSNCDHFSIRPAIWIS